MANTRTVKQHDTYPPLVATLSDLSGPVDLTTATAVKLIAVSLTHTITGACSISDPTNGVVSYAWVTGDTAFTGTYTLEFEVTWTGGGIQTFPNGSGTDSSQNYKILYIVADLG